MSILDFDLFDKVFSKFFARLLVDLVSVFVLVRYIYYRNYRRTDLFTTFFVFNVIIFMLTFLLNKVEMSMGAAFGLFAVFSMLRYRTENLSAKDVTYLFLVIAIGLISAISKGSWGEISLFSVIILLVTYFLEGNILFPKERGKTIVYDNVELITPDRFPELIEDLKKRTGLNIHRVEVENIDFIRDASTLSIYYYEEN